MKIPLKPSIWIATAALLSSAFMLSSCGRSDADAARIPIQHEGRVKSFESFARAELRLITGREKFKRKPAIPVMLDALKNPPLIAQIRWIDIEYGPLKEKLGLDASERHFAYSALVLSREKVSALYGSAQAKRQNDERPDKLEQKAERLEVQLQAVEELIDGHALRVIPPAETGGEWQSPYVAQPPFEPAFQEVVAAAGTKEFPSYVSRWLSQIHARTDGRHEQRIGLESLYHRLTPFRWAALLYFAGFSFWYFGKNRSLGSLGVIAIVIAFGFHTAGLALRVAVLGRPPVSNMYESMIYMNWALVLFALAFSLIRRGTTALAAGACLSGFVMLYSNLLPIDPSLEVLVPVLRSNYWLTIHVMTIVSSYGAFGLAMALGHRHLFLHRIGKFSVAESAASGGLIYRIIQLGVLLLGIGTVLGGVWANESWGRFWGWDPKETWALITFLGYLIIVHLRQTNRLSEWGTALGSVLGFELVLMTWYGVNFVLGRGLHSYGSGSGGMGWIVAFLAAEAAFLIYILTKPRT